MAWHGMGTTGMDGCGLPWVLWGGRSGCGAILHHTCPHGAHPAHGIAHHVPRGRAWPLTRQWSVRVPGLICLCHGRAEPVLLEHGGDGAAGG